MSCPVCQDADVSVSFSCKHGLCGECRSALRKAECPLCRRDVTSELSEVERKTIEDRKAQDKADTEREELEMLQAQFSHNIEEAFIENMMDILQHVFTQPHHGRLEIQLGENAFFTITYQ